MSENNENTYQQPIEETQVSTFFDLRNLILKFVLYWPWFVCSVIVFLVGANIYLRYQIPVYSVNGSVIIKEEKSFNGKQL